jgi:superfamily II DNA or RNA helicase
MGQYAGQDRRSLAKGLRELVFARSNEECQRCQRSITFETFHVSHLRAVASGGADHESNLQAWCARCNLTQGAKNAGDPRTPPRDWQLEALEVVIPRLVHGGVATVSAAPGAGKTMLGALAADHLIETDQIDRVAVFVPRLSIVDQWVDACAKGRHLQLKANSAIERRGQHGVVNTYQSLGSRDELDAHRTQADHGRTLVILDEVHHVGQEDRKGRIPSWARNVGMLTGDIDNLNVAGVLNLSGTLWRSSPHERISTVRYLADDEGMLRSLVDYEKGVADLVKVGQLRPLDLYRFSTRVQIADFQDLSYIDEDLADLDERPARAAMHHLASMAEWRAPFVSAVLDRLEATHRALPSVPVKALIVAARQEQARAFADEVDRQMRQRGLRPLSAIAVSDDGPEAQAALRDFRKQQRVGVLCTVDMAGEGYDCPDIAVIGYASNKSTALYVRQVVARAMRVTDAERELGYTIPAAIVVPDAKPLIEQLVAYLAPYTHEVLAHDPEALSGGPGDGPVERGEDGDRVAFRRYIVEGASEGAGHSITVAMADGTIETVDQIVAETMVAKLEALQVPGVYATRYIVAQRQTVAELFQSRPFDPLPPEAQAFEAEAGPTIEDRATFLQSQLKRCGGWWTQYGDRAVPVSYFNNNANAAGRIAKGKRPSASVEQLEKALRFAQRTIRQRCIETGTAVPVYAHANVRRGGHLEGDD